MIHADLPRFKNLSVSKAVGMKLPAPAHLFLLRILNFSCSICQELQIVSCALQFIHFMHGIFDHALFKLVRLHVELNLLVNFVGVSLIQSCRTSIPCHALTNRLDLAPNLTSSLSSTSKNCNLTSCLRKSPTHFFHTDA